MGFSPAWLDLREPADLAARDADLCARGAAAAGPAPVVVDLGAGTGASLRALTPYLAAGARWRLVDADAGLLALAQRRHDAVTPFVMDLRDIAALPLEGATLVTASALLDLMPEDWVTALAAHLAARGLPFLAMLSYDGVMAWDPALPGDDAVTAAFNRHQGGDKGLGPALGPASGARTAAIFRAAGFDVAVADSPWRLGADQTALQRDLVAGIAQAAAETGLAGAAEWGAARVAAAGTTACLIGHTDVLAVPGARA
ncbi:MAG TPA: class I SAM-dependent methyltransferase [Paracoccaceae bacterium]|nr:class I SAM-dependent methyltransferase [Paracoccaceae bacterium]